MQILVFTGPDALVAADGLSKTSIGTDIQVQPQHSSGTVVAKSRLPHRTDILKKYISGQRWAVDLNVLDESASRLAHYRVAIFDMDSTLIEEEVIDELAREAGRYDEVAALTADAMKGGLSFDDSLRNRLKLIAGLDAGALDRVRARLTPRKGARELIAAFNSAGLVTAVASGGFTALCDPLARDLGLKHSFANTLEVQGGKLTGRLVGDEVRVNAEGKRQVMEDLCRQAGVGVEAAIAIGDGANDIPMVQAAGLGIAWHAKQKLKDIARISLSHGDSLEVLLGFFTDLQLTNQNH